MNQQEEGEKKPEWLKHVQQQSWEPELLISGLILFALFQTPDLIDQLNQAAELQASDFFSNSTINEAISALLKISVYILIVGFIIHILLRSVWAAYAGLSYLYEDGINFSELNLPDSYTQLFAGHSFEERITSLEKICSGVFSASFLFFMVILGLIHTGIIISLFVVLIMNIFPGFYYVDELANFILFATGILFIFDLVTLGLMRRIPYLQKLYYPLYRAGRFLMLAPIYEDIYYGFLTNNKRWKLGIISALFLAFFIMAFIELRSPGSFTTSFQLRVESQDDALMFHGHYEDRMQETRTGRSVIPTDMIEGQVLRVYIPHFIENETNFMAEECLEKQAGTDLSDDERKLNCLNELYKIAINDSSFATRGLYQQKPGYDTGGLVYWQDISHLPRGPHTLRTYRWRSYPDTSFYQRIAQIEFYKASPRESSSAVE